jgi:hypothetical protein
MTIDAAPRKAVLEVPEGLSGEELLEWWADHLPQVNAVNSLLWKYTRAVRQQLRDQGAYRTRHGHLMTIDSDKMRWDEDGIIKHFPDLGEHSITASGLRHDVAESVLELLLESGLVDIEHLSHGVDVDLRTVQRVRKTLSPEQAAALQALATPNGKLRID